MDESIREGKKLGQRREGVSYCSSCEEMLDQVFALGLDPSTIYHNGGSFEIKTDDGWFSLQRINGELAVVYLKDRYKGIK